MLCVRLGIHLLLDKVLWCPRSKHIIINVQGKQRLLKCLLDRDLTLGTRNCKHIPFSVLFVLFVDF